MQLKLNEAVVFTNPGTASGFKNYLQLASDFGDAEVRVAVYDSRVGWRLLGAATANSNGEPRVLVDDGGVDTVATLLDVFHRKVSVLVTKADAGTVVCADLNPTLVPNSLV